MWTREAETGTLDKAAAWLARGRVRTDQQEAEAAPPADEPGPLSREAEK